MNYRHVYMLIIEHAKSEMKNGLRPKNYYYKSLDFPNQYFEFHHILPKSIFPNWKKKKENIVCLTAREHFFCHQLLTKIYPCQEIFCAVYMLASCNQSGELHISSRTYEKYKIERAKFAGAWVKKSLKGKTFEEIYDEEKAKIRKLDCAKSAISKKSWTDEQKEHYHNAMSRALKGRTSPTKGRKWYNNGKEQAMLNECPNGWVHGRLGGNTWTKGKHLSDAQKEKLRKARLGKKASTTEDKLKETKDV